MHSIAAMTNNTSSASEVYADSSSKLGRHSDNQSMDSRLVLYAAVALMTIIVVIGGIGNIMVILAVRITRKLQTASNAFVVNLSVCDLVFVMIILPFNIYTYLTDGWNLPLSLCKLIGFLGYTLTGTTIITITMIAWNRYKLVVDPQHYHHLFDRRHLAIMLALAWVVPILCLTPALLEVWGRFGYVAMMVTCNLLLDHDSQSFKLFLLIVRAAIPCFLILFYYISIYRTTRASHRRVLSRSRLPPALSRMDQMIQRKEMHLTKMMATIFIVFALSYFPCTISSIVDWNTVLSKRFHMFCLITVYVGSAINPLIYGLMNSQFQSAYYSILLCRCFSGPEDGSPPITKKHPQKPQGKKQKTKPFSKKAADTPSPFLVAPPNNPTYSPLFRGSSSDQSNSSTINQHKMKTHAYREMSIDSDVSAPLSFQEKDTHSDCNLHRTETEQTCLGDCSPEKTWSHT